MARFAHAPSKCGSLPASAAGRLRTVVGVGRASRAVVDPPAAADKGLRLRIVRPVPPRAKRDRRFLFGRRACILGFDDAGHDRSGNADRRRGSPAAATTTSSSPAAIVAGGDACAADGGADPRFDLRLNEQRIALCRRLPCQIGGARHGRGCDRQRGKTAHDPPPLSSDQVGVCAKDASTFSHARIDRRQKCCRKSGIPHGDGASIARHDACWRPASEPAALVTTAVPRRHDEGRRARAARGATRSRRRCRARWWRHRAGRRRRPCRCAPSRARPR